MEVTTSPPIIPPSLQFNFLRRLMANSSSRRSSDCDIRYRADIWTARRRTGIVESPIGIHSAFIINVIKGRYVLLRHPSVCCKSIIEAISCNSFRELPDADKIVVVVPLNPIAKQFPTISNHHPNRNISTQPYPTALIHTGLLQCKTKLAWLVVWFHLIPRTIKIRHEKGTSNRENWDIRKLVRILR